tara:strand:- start:1293 stop:1553 length:261 start_codon:yes stop_codon:yes gene_type:complete
MDRNNNEFKNLLVNECLDIMKRNDVKNQLKDLLKPLINTILLDIYPYIVLSILFVLISFLLTLGIFVMLIKYQKKLTYLTKQILNA